MIFTQSWKTVFQARPTWKILFTTVLASWLLSCSERDASDTQTTPTATPINQNAQLDLKAANQAFLLQASESAQLALQQGQSLEQEIQAFLDQPNQAALDALKDDWQQLEAALQRMYALEVISQNDAQSFQEIRSYLYRVQAHPIQPGYLDRFAEYAYSGLVYDIGFQLNPESLIQQHGLTDEEEVVLGIYAIEFMLFGTDSNRSANDYIEQTELSQAHTDGGFEGLREIPENRRRQLLKLQSAQLTDDLETLSNAISGDTGLSLWKQKEPQQQLSVIRRSLSSGLTQFLIQLAEYQDRYVSPLSDDAAEKNLPQEERQNEQQKTLIQLSQQLTSLKPWSQYFSPIEQSAINEAIAQTESLLSSETLVSNSNEEQCTLLLQTIYERIKPLI